MNEFGLIKDFFSDDWPTSDSVSQGVGDDGALLVPAPGHEIVVSVDTLIEGVHFLPSIDPADLGYRLVAVNLSDLAAMAATPRWMTLSIAMPEADTAWLRRFSHGMRECAGADGIVLVGGDTTRSPVCSLSLQVMGEVPTGTALMRSGAKVGDTIYVTGHPGNAAAGLERHMRGESSVDLYRAFARPSSRVAFARSLLGKANAAIDISDGLYADLGKMMALSGVAALLDIDALPLSDELLGYVGRDEAIGFALSGGDDYELLFTATEMPAGGGTPVTSIGEVIAGEGIECRLRGRRFDYTDTGYLHFK